MADICMCSDKGCPKYGVCYRAQATANPYRQSYFMWNEESAEEHALGICEHFWPVEKVEQTMEYLLDGLLLYGTSAVVGYVSGIVLANLLWWLKYEE